MTVDDAEVRLWRLTSPAIARLIEEGFDAVVIPLGAIEQHGPHLPLDVDARHASWLGVEVARALGSTLVAPTISVGCSDHHLAFSGTISIGESTLAALCGDYVQSLSRHGIRRVMFLSGHGGNFAPLTRLLPQLRQRYPELDIDGFCDLEAFMGCWQSAGRSLGLDDAVHGGHADAAETSIMLILARDLVRLDLAPLGWTGEMGPKERARIIETGLGSFTPNGVVGDARPASAELGRRCLELYRECLVRHFTVG